MSKRCPVVASFFVVLFALAMSVSAQPTYDFDLSGEQVVPPVVTAASGSCSWHLNALGTLYSINCESNAVDVAAAHIHRGPAGENGPIVYFFDAGTTFAGSVSDSSLSDQAGMRDPALEFYNFQDFLNDLNNGDLYAQVHTAANPAGELRGQLPVPPQHLYFPQFGNGGGLTSDIVLLNTATTGDPVTGSVFLYDPEGDPMEIGFETVTSPGTGLSEVPFALNPLTAQRFTTDGEGMDAIAGSAVAVADGPVGGLVRFAITGFGVAGVLDARPIQKALVPVRREQGGINTGVAVLNPDMGPCIVDTGLWDDGMLVDTGTLDLGPRAREAVFIDQLFPGTDTSDFTGLLSLETSGDCSFSAISLEQDLSGGVLTTLPVIPR